MSPLLIQLGQIDGGNKLQTDIDTLKQGFTFSQLNPSTVWTIHHNLGKIPAVVVTDSAGSLVVGEIEYPDINTVIITFCYPFGGMAYLN
jgi:hypothetical protein